MPAKNKYELSARIAACRELFVKYGGRSHKKIEAEMREMGFADFSRRILYKRTDSGARPGWIAEFGWNRKADPTEELLAGNAAALVGKAGSSGLTEIAGPELIESESRHNGASVVAGEGACGPVGEFDDFEGFHAWLRRVSPNMTWDWRHQIYLYERLQKITSGDKKRLMIFMPPRHGKSELVTVRYTAWRMRRKPEMKVILASYGQDLANTFSRSIKRVICEDLAQLQVAEEVGELQEVAESQTSGNSNPRTLKTPATPATRPTPATLKTPVSMFPFTSQRPINTAAQWGTAAGGGLRAVGVGGGVTGFGADLIVIDDPVKNRAQAESEIYRERLWKWYTDDLYTRLEPEGSIILIQTRWHEDDLAGRLLKQADEEGGEQWEVVDLPAIAEVRESLGDVGQLGDGETGDVETGDRETGSGGDGELGSDEGRVEGTVKRFKKRVIGFPRLYSHVNDDALANSPPYEGGVAAASADGVVLSGEVETRSNSAERRHNGGTVVAGEGACGPAPPHLLNSPSPTLPQATLPQDPLGRVPGDALLPERYPVKKLDEIRGQLGNYAWTSLYQQHPTPPGGSIFQREWLTNIIDAPPPGLKWYRGYDLAISTRTTADYTASFRVAMDEMGIIYIADGYRARIEFPEQRRYILERMTRERDTQHGIEDSAHAKAIVQDLQRERLLLRYPFRTVPVVGDKLTRALSWSPRAEQHKLRLVRGSWIDDFITEATSFPLGAHDDQIDAISVAVQMMSEMPDKKLYGF